MHRDARFFACSSSAPVRVEHEGGAASWLMGSLGGSKCAGSWGASTAEVLALSQSFFKPFVAGSEASLARFSPQLCLFRHLEGSLSWGSYLLFGISCT